MERSHVSHFYRRHGSAPDKVRQLFCLPEASNRGLTLAQGSRISTRRCFWVVPAYGLCEMTPIGDHPPRCSLGLYVQYMECGEAWAVLRGAIRQ